MTRRASVIEERATIFVRLRGGLATAARAMILAVLLAPRPARAQAHEEAVRLFQAGVEAAHAGRWVEARRAFERAYELLPRTEILVNLAAARAQTDELLEALEAYERASRDPDLDPNVRAEVERATADLRAASPRMRIEVRGLERQDEVRLDDRTLAEEALGGALQVNPGSHTVVVRRHGAVVAHAAIFAESGASATVQLVVVAATEPPEAAASPRVGASLASPPETATRARPRWPRMLGGGLLLAGAVGLGAVMAVSWARDGSCSAMDGGTCVERWALQRGPMIGYGVGAALSLGFGITFLALGPHSNASERGDARLRFGPVPAFPAQVASAGSELARSGGLR